MQLFRRILFWSHLVAGLIAGLFIGIMCFTGTILAFENEIVAWAERDARQVIPPANLPSETLAKEGATRLTLADLQRKLREAQPEFRPTSVTLLNSPTAAVTFTAGRDENVYANPYTGEIRTPASTKVHDFMRLMTDWHRYLGREGGQRPTGKLINGICNLAFFALAVTGLYLWMPRTWSWAGVKAIALFNWKAAGKARDFNWHNVIGLWSAPILIVLTLTAVPISFRWGGDLIYRIVGEEPPVQQSPGPASPAPTTESKRITPSAPTVDFEPIVSHVQHEFPRWKQITLRPTAQPPTVSIREIDSWPRTANTTLTLNPNNGEETKREGFGNLTTARQIRAWTRYLHTGQALGWPGQLVAGLACLGGLFLVYTGLALCYRRFFGLPLKAGK